MKNTNSLEGYISGENLIKNLDFKIEKRAKLLKSQLLEDRKNLSN